jgi:hypothetical protein
MTVTLRTTEMEETLERAYLLGSGTAPLPDLWVKRAERLVESPSVAFIAAVGAVLLAKATDSRVDAFVIQEQEGSAGAFSLRGPAKVLGLKRRAYGFDIGSSSDRDPINHGTLIGSVRWDVALQRITPAHKPFFQVILQWLADINSLDEEQALKALAAYIRVRQRVSPGASLRQLAPTLSEAPPLTEIVETLEGFVSADPEGGARGMALAAAAFRSAGLEASLPSRNDPRRIDIPIKRDRRLVIACEVKQEATTEAVADTLAADTSSFLAGRALLAVLRPGLLVHVNQAAVVERAEREHGVVLRITVGVRQLLHEALLAGSSEVDPFCAALPRLFGEALREIRAHESSINTWVAIASRWNP